MTIAIDSNKVLYTGNGVTTVFPFSFRVDNAAHLQAYTRVVATGVLTLLTQGVDYTVAGVPGAGSVTYNPAGVPIPATMQLLILRLVPVLQSLDINNQGGFYPDTLEAQLDLMTMVDQQQEEQLGRAVKSPYGQSGYDLPLPAATQILGWNAAGTALENKINSANLLSPADLRDLLDVVTYVTTLAGLKALDSTKDIRAIYDGSIWDWTLGDHTTRIAADTVGGIFAKADAIAATIGAWRRRFTRHDAKFYGAAASATRAANVTALQCAVNVGQLFVGDLFLSEIYPTNAAILVSNNLRLTGVSAFTSGITSSVGAAINLIPDTGIANNNTWYGFFNFSAISTDAGAFYGISYVSTGAEYLSNWIMEGVYASGTSGGAIFDSTGSTVGIFSCTLRRNWFANGLVIKDGGDSITILENTINGAGIGIFVNALKTGARQLVIRNNNITARSECVYLLNVTGTIIDQNWMETPSYLGSYTGSTGALLYAQASPNTRVTRNTIQPLNAVMIGLGQTAAAYSIRLNTSGDASSINDNDIAIGNTGHIQIGAGVTNTLIGWDNKFDVTAIVTDAGTGTFGSGNTPGVFNQLVSFKTTAQFTSTVAAESTNVGTGNGPYYDVYRNKAGGAAVSDGIGGFLWYMNNSVGVKTNLGYITMTVLDPVSGTEDGQFNIARMLAGALVVAATFGATAAFTTGASFTGALVPSTGATYSLGNTTQTWLNLFMATGSVINFNNGNYTITHAAGQLTFSGIVIASSYKVGANQVVGARDTGWTAMTGTGSKGALAAAAAGTASAAYVQAELQGALNRIAALEARLRSLDAAFVTHGLIGP